MIGELKKTYLGDGVYAAVDWSRGGVWLTTENGVEVTNKIFLEPSVLSALADFMGMTQGGRE